MSLNYTIDPAGRFLHVVASGIVAADDLAGHVEAVRNDEAAQTTTCSLFDLRQARPAIGYAELVTFREFLGGSLSDGIKRRWALLVCSDVSYGLARMFATLIEGLPLKVDIFEEEAEARAWLTDSGRTPSDRLELTV